MSLISVHMCRILWLKCWTSLVAISWIPKSTKPAQKPIIQRMINFFLTFSWILCPPVLTLEYLDNLGHSPSQNFPSSGNRCLPKVSYTDPQIQTAHLSAFLLEGFGPNGSFLILQSLFLHCMLGPKPQLPSCCCPNTGSFYLSGSKHSGNIPDIVCLIMILLWLCVKHGLQLLFLFMIEIQSS